MKLTDRSSRTFGRSGCAASSPGFAPRTPSSTTPIRAPSPVALWWTVVMFCSRLSHWSPYSGSSFFVARIAWASCSGTSISMSKSAAIRASDGIADADPRTTANSIPSPSGVASRKSYTTSAPLISSSGVFVAAVSTTIRSWLVADANARPPRTVAPAVIPSCFSTVRRVCRWFHLLSN